MSSGRLREALSKAGIALSWAAHHHLTEGDAKECLEVVDAALAEPLRNCDVGTAEEQEKRFIKYCERCNGSDCDHRQFMDESKVSCVLKWSQMPYEGGVK